MEINVERAKRKMKELDSLLKKGDNNMLNMDVTQIQNIERLNNEIEYLLGIGRD